MSASGRLAWEDRPTGVLVDGPYADGLLLWDGDLLVHVPLEPGEAPRVGAWTRAMVAGVPRGPVGPEVAARLAAVLARWSPEGASSGSSSPRGVRPPHPMVALRVGSPARRAHAGRLACAALCLDDGWPTAVLAAPGPRGEARVMVVTGERDGTWVVGVDPSCRVMGADGRSLGPVGSEAAFWDAAVAEALSALS